MRIGFDMSSVMWTCLLAGKDGEAITVDFEDKKVQVNTAGYGYENAINLMLAALKEFDLQPINTILVFEGMNSKRKRLMIDPTYKEDRGQRPNESYLQFNALKEMLSTTWRDMGATLVSQDSVEGDDVLGWLAENIEEDFVIVSNDGDLQVCQGTNRYGSKISTRIGGTLNENKYGPFPAELTGVYKALVGDSRDSIKGIKGFGDAAFRSFVGLYGEHGLYELLRMLKAGNMDEIAELVETCKIARKLFDGRNEAIKSYRLAMLHTEWVHTVDMQLQWQAGMVVPLSACTDDRLRAYYGRTRLVVSENFDAAVRWAAPLIEASPFVALDIETSSQDESDDWLEAQGNPEGVDIIGSTLTGLSITFGANTQYTLYFSVDHADTDNIDSRALKNFITGISKRKVIHNLNFELVVLKNEWDVFLEGCVDTKLSASYVDENNKLGLKFLSKKWFDYDQVNYDTVTTLQGPAGTLPAGGRDKTPEDSDIEVRQYKMKELPAGHVLSYACDDTICTAALWNFHTLHMGLDHHLKVYFEVEIDAAYLVAAGLVAGVPISLATMSELIREDDVAWDKAWAVLKAYLMEKGWEGTRPPDFSQPLDAKLIKLCHELVTGQPLATMVRTPAKLVPLIEPTDSLLAKLVGDAAASGDNTKLQQYVLANFTGDPEWKSSNKQKSNLLYDVMGLPIRLRNEATDAMRAAGQREGNPKTDKLALDYALKYDTDHADVARVVGALRAMQVVDTKRGLYYKPYPTLLHWKTGMLHSSMNQSATNTRRFSSSGPNVQQLPKQEKIEGEVPRFREVFVPHHDKAVVVSLDFSQQELRIIADYSKDDNMVACYVGEHKRDMHLLTALGIIARESDECASWDYDTLVHVYNDKSNPLQPLVKVCRNLGKKTNFTTEYGAQAPKLAETLLVTVEEAQVFIDAKEAAFPQAAAWKETVEEEVADKGYVTTKMGARRHLHTQLASSNRYEVSKAYRQGVNFKIQSSSAEQTKLAMGKIWKAGILNRFDCRFYMAVHDEVVFSIAIADLYECLPEIHAAMTAPYGEMFIPIVSSISFGKSFGPVDQIEIGEVPTREAIDAGLAQLTE